MTIKTDRATYLPSPVINPNSLGSAGWWFIDGLSGIKITRLTDGLDGAGFGTTYSIWPTANCNATRLYLLNSATNTYYTAEFDPMSGTRIGNLRAVPSLPARHYSNYESALWSGSDPDKLFLFVDAKLYSYRPSTQVYQIVKDLTPQLGADCSFRQQHKSLDDKRFAASGPLGFVVYDAEQDRILLDVRTTDMNGIALDKSGKWLLYVPDDDHTEYIYNVETGTREVITSDRITGLPDFTVGHLDVGTDFIAGNDRWAGAITARKFSAPHAFSRPFVYASDGWISHHVSMTATDENWALLSTYLGVVGPDPNRFKDEVFQVGVQGDAVGKVRRLFHHRALANETDFGKRYWQIPKANISRNGRFVFFTSNMGGSRNDLYVADLATPATPDQPPLPPVDPPPPPIDPPPIEPPPTSPAPAITITSPANGATVSGKVIVTIAVTETLDEAYLIVDDIIRGANPTAPHDFTFETSKVEDGSHSLYVRGWKAGKAIDSQKISMTVKNAVEPPVDPPLPPVDPPEPPPVIPCSISAPPSISIPRNGIGQISVTLANVTETTTVSVSGSDGQVTVNPLTRTVASPSAIVAFQVRAKNKRQVRTITFQSGCGSVSVKVNVT